MRTPVTQEEDQVLELMELTEVVLEVVLELMVVEVVVVEEVVGAPWRS